jgi:hypothetical protein
MHQVLQETTMLKLSCPELLSTCAGAPPPSAATNTPVGGATGDVSPASSSGGAGAPGGTTTSCNGVAPLVLHPVHPGNWEQQQQQQHARGWKEQQQQRRRQRQQLLNSGSGASTPHLTGLCRSASPAVAAAASAATAVAAAAAAFSVPPDCPVTPSTPYPTPEDSAQTFGGRSPLVSQPGEAAGSRQGQGQGHHYPSMVSMMCHYPAAASEPQVLPRPPTGSAAAAEQLLVQQQMGLLSNSNACCYRWSADSSSLGDDGYAHCCSCCCSCWQHHQCGLQELQVQGSRPSTPGSLVAAAAACTGHHHQQQQQQQQQMMGLGVCADASLASAGVGTFCLNASSSCLQQETAAAAASMHRPGSPLPPERRWAGPGGSWAGSSSAGGSSSNSHAHHRCEEQRQRQLQLSRLAGGWRGCSDGGESMHSVAAGSGVFHEPAAAGLGSGPGTAGSAVHCSAACTAAGSDAGRSSAAEAAGQGPVVDAALLGRSPTLSELVGYAGRSGDTGCMGEPAQQHAAEAAGSSCTAVSSSSAASSPHAAFGSEITVATTASPERFLASQQHHIRYQADAISVQGSIASDAKTGDNAANSQASMDLGSPAAAVDSCLFQHPTTAAAAAVAKQGSMGWEDWAKQQQQQHAEWQEHCPCCSRQMGLPVPGAEAAADGSCGCWVSQQQLLQQQGLLWQQQQQDGAHVAPGGSSGGGDATRATSGSGRNMSGAGTSRLGDPSRSVHYLDSVQQQRRRLPAALGTVRCAQWRCRVCGVGTVAMLLVWDPRHVALALSNVLALNREAVGGRSVKLGSCQSCSISS